MSAPDSNRREAKRDRYASSADATPKRKETERAKVCAQVFLARALVRSAVEEKQSRFALLSLRLFTCAPVIFHSFARRINRSHTHTPGHETVAKRARLCSSVRPSNRPIDLRLEKRSRPAVVSCWATFAGAQERARMMRTQSGEI